MKTVFTAALALLAFATTAQAGYVKNDDFIVSTKVIPVVLKRGDQVEYGRLVYTASVKKREQQTGDVSKPLSGHFIDDRQCNWQLSGHIQRQYFVTSITGQEDSQPAAAVNLAVTVAGNSNGLASFLDHDPCGDYRGVINRHVDEAKKEVLNQFDIKMPSDLENFKTEMEGVTVIINSSES